MRPYPRPSERAAQPPIWSCSGWGLACAHDYSRAGGLLPHHFTLTLSGGVFSVPLSASRPAPSLTAILPYGARTFLFPFKGSERPTHSGVVSVASFAAALRSSYVSFRPAAAKNPGSSAEASTHPRFFAPL